MKAKNHR